MFNILLQLLCFCGFIAVNITTIPPGVIGRGYYLHDVSLEKGLPSGRSIFKFYNDTCIGSRSRATEKQEKKYFQNTEEYYSHIASESDLSGDGYTLSVSLKDIYSSLKESNYSVKGMTLYVYSATKEQEFHTDCLYDNELTEGFIKHFNELPDEITNPQTKYSWIKYDIFLKNYGSHIATGLVYGSKFSQYVFSSYETDASKTDFEIAACSQLTDAEKEIKGCSKYTKDDYKRISKLDISSQWKVKGGNKTTRTAFNNGVTDDRITEFLDAAGDADESIEEKFKTMWDFLIQRFQESDKSAIKIALMKAYYEGFLSSGCSHLTYEGYKKGERHDLRRFVQIASKEKIPSYKCELAPVGCTLDSDCHPFFSSFSECYGKSCIAEDKLVDTSSSVKTSRKIQLVPDKTKGPFEGLNYDCSVTFWGQGKCNSKYRLWEQVWPRNNQCHDSSCKDNYSAVSFDSIL